MIDRLDVLIELMLEPVLDSLETRSLLAADLETVSTESSTSEPGTAAESDGFCVAVAEAPRAGGSEEGTGGGFREVTVADVDDPDPLPDPDRLEI